MNISIEQLSVPHVALYWRKIQYLSIMFLLRLKTDGVMAGRRWREEGVQALGHGIMQPFVVKPAISESEI